jgi:uncharacterized protein
MIETFTETVAEELGNYVYRLVDPRNGETFYVGKGRGNRVFAHMSAALTLEEDEDESSTKLSRIREIKRSGLDVLHVIHRHGIAKEAIFEVEAALIDAYPGLENIAGGHGSGDRGPMHANQIIDKYDLPKLDSEPEHKLVLININRFSGASPEEIYEQTRLAWRIDRSKASQADYVLAVIRGVVKEVFVADEWLTATRRNFPQLPEDIPSRAGFNGRVAPQEIRALYAGDRGKRIAIDALRHVQYPVRYWKL